MKQKSNNETGWTDFHGYVVSYIHGVWDRKQHREWYRWAHYTIYSLHIYKTWSSYENTFTFYRLIVNTNQARQNILSFTFRKYNVVFYDFGSLRSHENDNDDPYITAISCYVAWFAPIIFLFYRQSACLQEPIANYLHIIYHSALHLTYLYECRRQVQAPF